MTPTDVYFAFKLYGTLALLGLLGIGLVFLCFIVLIQSIREMFEKHSNKQIDEAYEDEEK